MPDPGYLKQPRRFSLLIVVAVAAAAVGFQQPARSGAVTTSTPPPAAPQDPAPPSWAVPILEEGVHATLPTDSAADAHITGRVLEQIDVEKYSYLRVATSAGPETWTAVPLTTPCVGQTVVISNVEPMTHFTSASLGRTFDLIYFGVLGSGQELDDPHQGETAPHPGPGKDADAVAIVTSAKAPGPLGRSVAELNASEQPASGHKVRVRATVVKVTTGVLGRTFLHLRDGTGTAPLTNDLTATSTEDFVVGAEVMLEGTLEVDKDFGSGYRYRVLLSDARRVAP